MTDMERTGRKGYYYGWNVVAVCVLAQVAAMGLTYNAFSLFLNGWTKDLGSQISELQLAMLALTLMGAITSPFCGVLADKLPPRRLFGIGLFAMGLFYFAVGSATATWQIIALYAVSPFAMGICTAITANALIPRWFLRRRGLALGLSAMGNGLAGVILPPIIAVALPIFGWRAIWQFGGVLLAVVITPLVVLTLRNRPTEREGLHYIMEEGSGAGSAPQSAAAPQITWKDVITSRNFWLLNFIFVALLSTQSGVAQNLGPYVSDRGFSPESAGILLSLLSASGIVSMLIQGMLSDRYGNRLPFAVLAVIVAAGALLLAVADDLPLVMLGCVLVGFGFGLFTLLAAGLAEEFGANGMGLAFGMCMIFVPLTSFVAVAVAKTQEVTGSYSPALMAIAVLVLLAGGLILLLRERSQPVGAVAPVPSA